MSWAFCFLPRSNTSLPSCQVCTCLHYHFSYFSIFSQHFGTRLHHPFRTGATNYYLQTRPASVISSQGPRYLSLPPPPILCRVQMFVGSLEWDIMRPWKNQVVHGCSIWELQNDPNFPSQFSYWCWSPISLAAPMIPWTSRLQTGRFLAQVGACLEEGQLSECALYRVLQCFTPFTSVPSH